MKQVKFKITGINYDVDYNSAYEALADEGKINDSWTEQQEEKAVNNKIKEIIESLPKSLIVVIDKKELDRYEPEDRSEPICDKISEITGWCVNSFNFDEIKEKKPAHSRN